MNESIDEAPNNLKVENNSNLLLKEKSIVSLNIRSSIHLNELSKTMTIEERSIDEAYRDETKYEDWLNCLRYDPAGRPYQDLKYEFTDLNENPGGYSIYGDLSRLVLPRDIQLKIFNLHCGYSDNIFFLKILKGGKEIRYFTHLFGSMRNSNISPDNTKIVFAGIRDPEKKQLDKETFIYDFVNDTITQIANTSCNGSSQIRWIDNKNLALITELNNSDIYNRISQICIWNSEGVLLRVFDTQMEYFFAAPGGMIFNGDIKMFDKDRILFYLEKKQESEGESKYFYNCILYIEDPKRGFLELPIIKSASPGQTLCGKINQVHFNSETDILNFNIDFIANRLGLYLQTDNIL
jgi:hypothetical protein